MQRILVIDNVSLWISLNRHFAGEREVRVSEATTLNTGMRLAAVEDPELVVCSSESAEKSPAELSKMFREAGIDEKKVICVVEPDAMRLTPAGLQMQICSPDQFVALVEQSMRGALQPKGHVSVDLLAHFERLGAQEGEEARGFFNVLEIEGTEFLIESTIEMQLHEVVELNFFLPRFEHLGDCHDRCQVSLRGEIRSCHDKEKLHYRFVTSKVGERSKEYLQQFVESKRSQRENPR